MNDITYIYEVYRQMSFSAAAKKLHVSQPALSTAVRRTEDKYGITIFDRSSSPIKLTEEGKVFIHSIEQIHRIDENLRAELSDLAGLKHGKVTISCENFVLSFVIPKVLMLFAERFPGISVELIETGSPQLLQLLLSEKVDLIIGHTSDSLLYTTIPLFTERIFLAVPRRFVADTPLAASAFTREEIIAHSPRLQTTQPLPVSAFSAFPFLLLKPGSDMHTRSRDIFNAERFKPTVALYLDQLITSYHLACSGMGIAFVTDTLIQCTEGDNCLFYPLGGESACREMTVIHKKKRYISKAARAFIDTVKDAYPPQ